LPGNGFTGRGTGRLTVVIAAGLLGSAWYFTLVAGANAVMAEFIGSAFVVISQRNEAHLSSGVA